MSAAVAIISPTNEALISNTDGEIVIDVYDPGNDPARQFSVTVNGTIIYTWLAGSTTYLDSDFSLAITSPAPYVARFTFLKLSLWLTPITIPIVATYAPNPDVPPSISTSTVICATLTLVSTNPANEQPNASPQTSVQFVATSTATIHGVNISIGGQQAFNQSGPTQTWARPDFSGTIVNSGNAISASVVPRRDFSSQTTVQVALNFTLTTNDTFFIDVPLTYSFFAVAPAPTQIAITQQNTPLDRPIRGFPALESQRAVLLRALTVSTFGPSLSVLACARSLRSSLAPLVTSTQTSELRAQAAALRAEYQADVTAAATALTEVEALWESAILEARRLGVEPSILDLISRTYASPYPQERVGAVSALLLSLPTPA